ncbi:MAG: methylated-DNA--[protein]-cysteine S-methyltransferase [candidate division WOR-3 bacterium]|nr:methylated-DNA--[protein]-cysteine S-methyltransferase [candidate division WOR-3 bacterium]
MIRTYSFHFSVLTTSFGKVVVVWRSVDNKIVRIYLPGQYHMFRSSVFRRSGVEHSPHSAAAKPCSDIASFLCGREIKFNLDPVDWSMTSGFQRRVLLLENKIPRGMVSTYGRIARKLGLPRAARAVGNALARNPFPLIIPCHRAVRFDGSLGGYAGGVRMKKMLLELEGVEFDRHGRVITKKFW